ncbi:MAG TPA: DUF2505 family protein [Albitalea sp.]
MDVTTTLLFATTLERLWHVFADPRYVERKQHALGAQAVTMRRFVATARRIEVEHERRVAVAVDAMPPWMRAWFADGQTLRERTAWCRLGERRAAIETHIDAVGQPLEIAGAGRFAEPIRGIVFMRVDWRITSSLPTLGQELERLFAAQLGSLLRRDRAFTVCYAAYAASRVAARASQRSGTFDDARRTPRAGLETLLASDSKGARTIAIE